MYDMYGDQSANTGESYTSLSGWLRIYAMQVTLPPVYNSELGCLKAETQALQSSGGGWRFNKGYTHGLTGWTAKTNMYSDTMEVLGYIIKHSIA